ncbi:MAG: amino acid permease [Elusimicrobia bacterium]|nr:amino acid permease [Elusimicrobiota bacterium]
MSEPRPPSPSLLRGLGVWDAGAVVVGCVIGAGIFRLSDSVAQRSPSGFMFLLAWALGGLLSLAGALTYAELSTLFPKTGGDYVFLTQGYGRMWGFLFGWTKLFVQRVGTISILAYVFAQYAGRVFGFPPEYVRLVATGGIGLLTLVNIVGLKPGKSVQNLFTALKVLAIGGIILAGALLRKGSIQNFQPFWPEWSWSLVSSTGLALIFVLWTYGGWENAAYVAEEVKDPQRNLPKAIIGGLLGTTGLYLIINVVYLYYLPLEEMRRTDLVAAGTMDKIWLGWGGWIAGVMVMISTLGALNGYILTGARILYALGRDHTLFRKLAIVSPRTHTPVLSLILNASIAALLVWTGTLDKIVTYTEIVIYLFFALSGASVFVFRRRGLRAEGAYRVWGYPWTTLLFILMSLAFAVNAILEQPVESLRGVAVASLGIPLYWVSERLSRR